MPEDRNHTLFCIYPDFMTLRRCLNCLRAIGVRANDVTVLFPEGILLMLSSEGTLLKTLTNGPGKNVEGDVGTSDPTRVLLSLGIPTYDVAGYGNRIRNGGILLSVRPCILAMTDRVKEILEQTGAKEILMNRAADNRLRPLVDALASRDLNLEVACGSIASRPYITD
jgi:hypothetical protein